MANLSIFVLGPPKIELNGSPVELPRRKATALLIYVAVSNESHSREKLATFFWPDSDQARAYAYLRNSIWEINRSLGEDWLITDRTSVGINPNADIYLDLHEFQTLLAQVRPHTHPKDAGCQDCEKILDTVNQLYRGDFLAGFGLPDSHDYDEWQFFQAEEYRQALMDGLVRMIRMQVANGNLEIALKFARRWSSLDPINEQAHRELMQIYVWTGQRNAAIRQYRECENILRRELKIEPEAATVELFKKIKSGQLEQAQVRALSPEIFPVMQSLAPVSSDITEPDALETVEVLPNPLTPFIGRHTERKNIAEHLANPNFRLITLLGPGGIGKTRLAIQIAHEQREDFKHGVCFVSLAALRPGQPMMPVIVEALDIPITDGDRSSTEQLFDFLRPRHLLLVLDNFEHLITEASFVNELLQQAPQIKILVTSRERLNLQSEHVTEISGLNFPETQDLENMPKDNGFVDKYCAVEFFLQAAQRAHSTFEIKPQDYPAIARITQLVGGLPLGLELAASWVHVLTPAEISTEIEQSLDFLESDLQDLPARQRSMRAIFDYSWKLMSAREKQIFPKLSVFRGGFSRESARKIIGITPRDLMGLVNKSLIQRSRDGRFDLHPLLRQYAAEILNNLEGWKIVHDAHCAYFATALEDLGSSMMDQRQRQAFSVLDADIDNAWAAWEWALENRQIERIDQATFGLLNYLLRQVRFDEGIEALHKAELALVTNKNSHELRVYSHILAWRALFEMRIGQIEASQPFFQQSWAALEEASAAGEDTRYERAFLYSMKAIMVLENGDLDTAQDLLEQSLSLFKEIDHKYGVSETLFEMAWLSSQQGNIDAVNDYFIKSLEIKRQIGDYYGLANELYHRGVQEAFQYGNIGQAKEFYWESSDLFQDLGDPVSNVRSLRIMDDLYIISGWFDIALVARKKLMKLYQNLGVMAGIGWQYAQLGEAHHHLGDYENAEKDGRRALEVLQDREYPTEQAYARWQLGMTLLARDQFAEAHQRFQECVEVYADSNRKDGVGSGLAGLARTAYALGNPEKAWAYVLDAIQHLNEIRHIFWMFYALATVALLLADQGEQERAIEIYNLISGYDFVANSKLFEDLFGRHLQDLAVDFPVNKAVSMSEKARALKVWEIAQELLATETTTI